MNEPKQITENELAILFCDEACNTKACTERQLFQCVYRNAVIKIAESKFWIKPDPTPEEEFSEWLSNDLFIDDIFAEDLVAIESKALEAMAKIRKEYTDA
jgi:hypothetical protein